MKLLASFACFLAACHASPLSSDGGKIGGGAVANIDDYPYTTSFQSGGSHFCSAVLINPEWALTAAHCLSGLVLGFTLRAGSGLREQGGTVHQASRKVAHPMYNAETLDYDIGLIKLLNPFELSPSIGVVALPAQGEVTDAGVAGTTLGWGVQTENGPFATELQMAGVLVEQQDACATAYADTNAVTESMICAGPLEGATSGVCQGDSGGPLVVDDVLVGITSWSLGCARPGFPGVFARVALVRDWITETAGV